MPEKITPTLILISRLTCHSVTGRVSGGSVKCEHCTERPTPRADLATDYFCEHPEIGKRQVMSYVEGNADLREVPKWCPLALTKAQLLVLEQLKSFDANIQRTKRF